MCTVTKMSGAIPDNYVTTLGAACPIIPSRSVPHRVVRTGERRINMGKARKGVSWICILCTFLVGCYSSAATVEPNGEGKLPSGKIFSVVTKDSTRYQFDTPATAVGDSIVGKVGISTEGVATKQRVSIPVTDVAYTSLKIYRPASTIVLVIAVASGLLIAGFSASMSGMHIAGQ